MTSTADRLGSSPVGAESVAMAGSCREPKTPEPGLVAGSPLWRKGKTVRRVIITKLGKKVEYPGNDQTPMTSDQPGRLVTGAWSSVIFVHFTPCAGPPRSRGPTSCHWS